MVLIKFLLEIEVGFITGLLFTDWWRHRDDHE
jgi:hypothetical protein